MLVSGATGKAIPLTLFGGLTFIAGLLTLLLPETLKRKLPETIEDAENFTRWVSTKQSKTKRDGDRNLRKVTKSQI